jgi:hypothetical protein
MQLSAFASHVSRCDAAKLLHSRGAIALFTEWEDTGCQISSCYAKDVHPGDGIRWRRQHRQVHRYHAAGVERLPCWESPTARLMGLCLRQGRPSSTKHLGKCRRTHHGECPRGRHHLEHRARCWDDHEPEPGMATCSNGFWARSSPLQEKHSPSQPFLVSNWVGGASVDRPGWPAITRL